MENSIELRKLCKKMMVDLGVDTKGSKIFLAKEISTVDDVVNSSSLTMALSGYRFGARSVELLMRLYSYLEKKLEKP